MSVEDRAGSCTYLPVLLSRPSAIASPPPQHPFPSCFSHTQRSFQTTGIHLSISPSSLPGRQRTAPAASLPGRSARPPPSSSSRPTVFSSACTVPSPRDSASGRRSGIFLRRRPPPCLPSPFPGLSRPSQRDDDNTAHPDALPSDHDRAPSLASARRGRQATRASSFSLNTSTTTTRPPSLAEPFPRWSLRCQPAPLGAGPRKPGPVQPSPSPSPLPPAPSNAPRPLQP